MNRMIRITGIICTAALIILTGCSTHKLARYNLPDYKVAAVMMAPNAPEMLADYHIHVDKDNLVSTFFNLGTNIAKLAEVEETRVRLRAATAEADIPQRVRDRVFEKATNVFGFTPVDDYHYADLLFDVRIRKYGIEADGWLSAPRFILEAEVILYDIRGDVLVWDKRIHESQPVGSSFFGGHGSVGNIFTVMQLSKLDDAQIKLGLEYLADLTAEKIVSKINQDYTASRQ